MQALSLAVHIPLVCFAISFPAMVLFAEWRWLRTGDELYLTLAQRWTRILVALFAVGVVTGTILSFELGLLWPSWMASYASVFGLAFGIEGFAFFMEAIFIGIYVYSWNRLSPRTHFLTGIPIAIAGVLGSLMVISVNGWMNHPTGFRVVDGKVVDVHPLHALFVNPYFWHELVHMYLAGYIVAGFILAGVYAFARLRGRWTRYEQTAFAIPFVAAALAAPVNIVVGDWAGRAVAHGQPIKLAAVEGLGHTTKGAPLHLLGWYDERKGTVSGGLEIPRLLSLLAYHDPNATVAGVDTVPPADRPNVNVVRVSFQLMVAIGFLLTGLGLAYFWVRRARARLPDSRWFYRLVVAAGPLAIVALEAGWVVTEVGRQPWIVYGTMRTSEAVTRAGGIPVGYGTLVVVYLGLAAAVAWILLRLSRRPLEI